MSLVEVGSGRRAQEQRQGQGRWQGPYWCHRSQACRNTPALVQQPLNAQGPNFLSTPDNRFLATDWFGSLYKTKERHAISSMRCLQLQLQTSTCHVHTC